MARGAGFGTGTAGILSRDTNNSVQIAKKENENGDIIEGTTYGLETEITETSYTDTFANEAVNGESGDTLVSQHNYSEVNNEYAKQEKTTWKAGVSPI